MDIEEWITSQSLFERAYSEDLALEMESMSEAPSNGSAPSSPSIYGLRILPLNGFRLIPCSEMAALPGLSQHKETVEKLRASLLKGLNSSLQSIHVGDDETPRFETPGYDNVKVYEQAIRFRDTMRSFMFSLSSVEEDYYEAVKTMVYYEAVKTMVWKFLEFPKLFSVRFVDALRSTKANPQ